MCINGRLLQKDKAMIGHQRQLQLLDMYVHSGTMSHAYLFTGPRHVGKLTMARVVVAALLCEKKGTGTGLLFSCSACNACRLARAGTHPDIYTVDAEEREEHPLRLEDIQRLRERAALSAYGGTHIFFIRDVSRVTREAANALLKVLEEPRGNVVFFLLASVVGDVLPTIQSRCAHVRFWPLSEDVLSAGLQSEHRVKEETALLAARLSRGLAGVAFRLASSPEQLKTEAQEQEHIATLLDASIAERMNYAEKLREKPEAMREWFTKSITMLACTVHAALQKPDGRAVTAADACRLLMEREEQFLKPYGVKRILFEDALIQLET